LEEIYLSLSSCLMVANLMKEVVMLPRFRCSSRRRRPIPVPIVEQTCG